MKRCEVVLLLAVALVVLLGASARAAKLNVPGDYPDIQAAVDAAGPGDKVVIGPGHYTDGVEIVGRNGITLVGESGHELEFVGVLVKDSYDIRLKKLRIVNCGDVAIGVVDSHSVDVKKCEILGPTLAGIVLDSSDTCVLKKNHVQGVLVRDPLEGTGIMVGNPDEPGTQCYGNVVLRNEVEFCNGRGIQVYGEQNDVAKNTVLGNQQHGMVIRSAEGDFNTVRKNKVYASGDKGIQLLGSGHKLIRNEIRETGGDGVDVEADGVYLYKNRIEDTGDDGISIDHSVGSTFERNRIDGAAGDGVRLASESTGNTLLKNRATNSADHDLLVLGDSEDNTFVGNDFPESNL